MRTLWQDLRYGVRTLRKKPAFTFAVVISLAVGIGATAGIFSVVNAVLLRPMPFPDVARLVMIWETKGGSDLQVVSPANYLDWKSQSTAFEQMAIMDGGFSYSLLDAEEDEPTQPIGARVSQEFFSTLGVRPLLGRTFAPGEVREGGPPVVMLSHEIWRRLYGGDPQLVGRTVALADVVGEITPCTVVGILPPGFRFPENAELWLPYSVDTIKPTQRGGWCARVVARLKPGVKRAQAQAEMDVIAERLARAYPETNRDSGVRVTSLHEHLVQNARLSLCVFQGAVVLVLLVAVANVANLLLARLASHGREMALRAALGAGRGRLTRQLLTESMLLAVAGGGLGLFVAWCGVHTLGNLAARFLPRAAESRTDGLVLAFTFSVSLASGLVFGSAPAIRALRTDRNEGLKERGALRGLGTAGPGLMRYGLVTGEIALSLMLLVGAGLFLRSFVSLRRVQLGFRPENVLTVELGGIARPVHEELLERLSSLPSVQAVGGTNYLPIAPADCDVIRIEGEPPPSADKTQVTYQKVVTPGYFRAMGMPLLQGRSITPQDVEGSPPVVVVNEAFVKRLLGTADPIGRRLADGRRHTIVGVVGDARDLDLEKEAQPQVYYSHRQKPMMQAKLVIRTQSDPAAQAGAIRAVIRAVEKDRPILSLRTMQERIDSSTMPRRFQTTLAGLSAAVGLILAAVGIYGVVNCSVAQRVHELGIRMALGASESDVLKGVLRQGLRLAGAGIGIGLAGAFALTRVIASLLYGVQSTDATTFMCVSLLMAAVALLACYLPARRAARTDPIAALRYE